MLKNVSKRRKKDNILRRKYNEELKILSVRLLWEILLIDAKKKRKTNENALLLIENDEYNNKSDFFSLIGLCALYLGNLL